MKSAGLKTVITTDTKSFQNAGVLHLEFTGEYFKKAKEVIIANKFGVGSTIEITIDKVNTSKTVAQNNTFHDLLMMYWKSGIPSDESYEFLKCRIKNTYGVKAIFISRDLQWLKSWSAYTLKEGQQAIDGLIEEMLQSDYSSKKFDEMIKAWNEFKKPKVNNDLPEQVREIF